MQKSLSIREITSGVNHASVAQSMSGVADILQMKGKYEEALKLHKYALDIREKIKVSSREIGYSYHCLGMNALLRKEFDEAKQYFDKSLEIRESLRQKLQVGAHVSVIETNIALGRLLVEQGQLDAGINLLEESNKSLQKVFGKDDHPLMIDSLISLSNAMNSQVYHYYEY
jgi:tetratricopeptide (TPR) repeat protein